MEEVYYIRPADSETARGPFDIDKLNTLGEADQLTAETLYYDETLEAWAAIGSNDELNAKIFPKHKKLSLRTPKETSETAGSDEKGAARKVISVEDMRAAAEGQTEETEHLRDELRWQHRAAAISIPILTTVCFVSAATYIYPSWNIIQLLIEGDEGAIMSFLQRPLLILGAFDLIFGICLALAATEIYPLLRFRAMLGLGFFGYTYWSSFSTGDPIGLYLCLANLAFGIGVFMCTLSLQFRTIVVSGALSFIGALTFAYFTTFAPLLERFL
jgi:hypothetical protein|tara:strand:+ start:1595 stop:2410 length:816 start_codon:yes stop_codon:yes gene_type:complete